MSNPESFDPYYTWLGIPPAQQPPNHYRLLGIEAFEGNPDVIERAADRCMADLRTYQAGKRSADSQRLLNEVAAAAGKSAKPEEQYVLLRKAIDLACDGGDAALMLERFAKGPRVPRGSSRWPKARGA